MRMCSESSATEALSWAGIEIAPLPAGPFVDDTEVVPRIRFGQS